MPEAITLSVQTERATADARRSLASWLRADDRLHAAVTTAAVDPAPPSGATYAEATDALLVAVDDAGSAMVLIQAVAGWMTNRRDEVTVRLTGPGAFSAELDVPRARDMGQVTALIEAAVRAVTPAQP